MPARRHLPCPATPDQPGSATSPDTTLARRNLGLFATPAVRDAIQATTGLSEKQVDQVAAGLSQAGVALLLPHGADLEAKYANAIMLVRDHGYSISRAARELGISATHLNRKISRIGANGDFQKQAEASDRRILEMSQSMSIMAGEKLLERMEQRGDQMTTTELAKIYTGSTNQVAAKQRWSQGGSGASTAGAITVLAKFLVGREITVSERDPADEAVDVPAPSR
jgi:molybdenum-dependent DNA-binding transcriptional regulator ModE